MMFLSLWSGVEASKRYPTIFHANCTLLLVCGWSTEDAVAGIGTEVERRDCLWTVPFNAWSRSLLRCGWELDRRFWPLSLAHLPSACLLSHSNWSCRELCHGASERRCQGTLAESNQKISGVDPWKHVPHPFLVLALIFLAVHRSRGVYWRCRWRVLHNSLGYLSGAPFASALV